MNKIILHIDLNTFFVRCEELKNPSLVGKPVLIGHNGRGGIISTCSYEARKYGASSGMPTYKALSLCPNAILIGLDFPYYQEKSNEFFNFLKRYTDKIEIASIDECYLDFTNILSNVADQYNYLLNLQLTLRKQTGLNCSIGVAPNKFLAKMASDMKKPNGITFLNKTNIKEKLYPLPIDSFFGIGKKTSPKLKEIGIKTIGDLAERINSNDPTIRSFFGKFYYTIQAWVNGDGNDEIDTSEFDPASIGHSTTLDVDSSSFKEIEPYINDLCKMVSTRCKKYKKLGQTVSLVVKDTGFKLHNKSIGLQEPTNDEDVILKTVCKLYKENFEGLKIRLVGVTLSRFVVEKKESSLQMNLWNYEQAAKDDKTNKLIDTLNKQLRKPSLIKASSLKKGK